MAEAWGPNFYRQSQTMLLRFDRDFHDRYIQDTSRHDTFRLIDIRAAAKLIEKYTQTSDRQQLLNILQNRDNDAYYQAIYRIDDNNTIMRLRAWGPKVEVLLPGDLRDRMAIDAQNTWELYK